MTDSSAPRPHALAHDYETARADFLAAAEAAGAEITRHEHPRTGLHDEPLTLDVATFGPADAARRVLVVSGTHGVEGYCGSAMQTGWLRTMAAERPDDVRIVVLHALNPYGFSWVRRVNEDNIDLNRNFIDWTGPRPSNDGYGDLADLLVPERFDEAEQQRTVEALLVKSAELGAEQMQQVVSGGQYDHPTGVFYGGAAAAWSHDRLVEIWAAELAGADEVRVLDLHTGLGPRGFGELISHETVGSDGYRRATALWGEVRSMTDGESVSAALTGDWLARIEHWADDTTVTAVAIEYGTVDTITVLLALRADAWMHAHGDPRGDDSEAIRAQVRAAFIDDEPDWIDLCWEQFARRMTAALTGAT
ncbi:MAG: DUF2817 domain-containing protein [Actinomycetota bacterium]